MDTAVAATLRAQSKKKLSKKNLNTREGPLRIRGADSPWNRDLCGTEVYTRSNAKPTWFTGRFFGARYSLTPKISTASQPALTKNGRPPVFFLVFIKKFL